MIIYETRIFRKLSWRQLVRNSWEEYRPLSLHRKTYYGNDKEDARLENLRYFGHGILVVAEFIWYFIAGFLCGLNVVVLAVVFIIFFEAVEQLAPRFVALILKFILSN